MNVPNPDDLKIVPFSSLSSAIVGSFKAFADILSTAALSVFD